MERITNQNQKYSGLQLIIWHFNGNRLKHHLSIKISQIMNYKVLFLDIDGVLNSKLYYKYIYKPEDGGSRFDPYCVILVQKLVEEFSLKVVISSTWRDGAMNRLKKELNENNFMDYLHEDWLTPIVRPASRGKEIKLWIDNHPEVKDYLILDDNENLLDHQFRRFVKTSNYLGMVQECYHQARNLLLSYNQIRVEPTVVMEY